MIGPDFALTVACRAAALTLFVGFLEQLAVFERAFGLAGPFSIAVSSVFRRRRVFDPWLDVHLRAVFVSAAVGSAVLVIRGPFAWEGSSLVIGTLIGLGITKRRRVMGSDGAEQMAVLCLFATAGTLLAGAANPRAVELATMFIAGQSALSYATAGLAKAVSPIWRRGDSVGLILGSEGYGQAWAAALSAQWPGTMRAVTRAIVVFECVFSLVFVAPPPLVWAMLGFGTALHLACALSMGLNAFLLAFPGTYLCVAYWALRIGGAP